MNRVKSNEDETDLDQRLIRMQRDKSSLNNYILDSLETQIKADFQTEIRCCRRVQALFPIISILFTDQTRVEVSLQIKLNDEESVLGVSERVDRFSIQSISSFFELSQF